MQQKIKIKITKKLDVVETNDQYFWYQGPKITQKHIKNHNKHEKKNFLLSSVIGESPNFAKIRSKIYFFR